jgi:hypothetical protein
VKWLQQHSCWGAEKRGKNHSECHGEKKEKKKKEKKKRKNKRTTKNLIVGPQA